MNAEIITIGDEILIGQIVDTNSAWISERLNAVGIRVTSRISVGDEARAIADAVTDALNSADIVITTGGLGPTKDDITKTILAGMFGCGMVEDRATYLRNEQMLKARGIEYNALNRSQAMIPDCCGALPNPNGTAPGMWFDRGEHILISLPGVPFEMKRLMDDEVLPRLRSHFSLGKVVHKTMVTFGMAESILAETLTEWENALPEYLHLAYLPAPSGIRLRLSAYDGDDAARQIDERFRELEKIIPGYIVGYGDATVESAVAAILVKRGETLAVAESCTGGAVSARFTAMAGASDYFLCGVVSYANTAKSEVLGVNAENIERYGAVSQEVAEQMVLGAKQISGADYAISTTGIAGPAGGTDEKPVGTVWISVAHPAGVLSRKFIFGHLRDQNIERASAAAINLLRLLLIERQETQTNIGTL